MGQSLFRKKPLEDRPPTHYELIEPEIVHLKKGYSIRHGEKHKPKRPLWFVTLVFFGFIGLYVMDPICYAWYKGDAINAYVYLHNYTTSPLTAKLATCGILSPDEINTLNHRQGSFQDSYPSPKAALDNAQTIINYMQSVRDLHAGKYEELNPIGRMRYAFFIWPGLILPRQWDFLDPSI